MKDSVKIILIFLVVVCISSCEKVTLEPEEYDFDEPVSFEQDIVPIFENKCVACHNDNRNPDLRSENAFQSLTTGGFVNTSEPELSTLYEVLQGSHDSRASELEKNKILAWIKQGAKND